MAHRKPTTSTLRSGLASGAVLLMLASGGAAAAAPGAAPAAPPSPAAALALAAEAADPAQAPSVYATLTTGDQGKTVRALQHLLRHAGYPVDTDASYGPDTTQKVEQFQDAEGLPPNGTANHATFAELVPTIEAGDQGDHVRAMQVLLNRHGAGLEVDGSYGPATQSAVTSFQQSKGLTENLTVSHVTMKTLFGETDSSDLRSEIVSRATSYQGQHYTEFCATRTCLDGGASQKWCQDFVWYVWKEAGVPGAADRAGKTFAVADFFDYNTANHKTQLSQAEPGDAIVWWVEGGDRHVGIITQVNSDNTVDITHGAWGDNSVGFEAGNDGTLAGTNIGFAAIVPPIDG